MKVYEEATDEWIDITVTHDTLNNIICGETTHLSFFALTYYDIPATVEINPDVFNLKSKGNFITCYIEITEEGYDAYDIDQTVDIVVEYNGNTLVAFESPREIENNILMVKFDRSAVQDACVPGSTTITIAGQLTDGSSFEGSDTINVINPP